MRALARTHGAITIVNAIPAGIGAALGVDLWTEAEAEVVEDDVEVIIEGEAAGETQLAETAARHILRKLSIRRGVRVRTRSNIPVGRGLKSSSAASAAVVLAVSRALGLELGLEDAVKISVEASIEAGVTVTGAYDDAYTCVMGGVNITDNRSMRVLARWKADEALGVIILVPEEKIYTGSVDVKSLRQVKRVAERAAQLALMGKIWDAMTLNGLAVASALRLDIKPAMEALRSGALAAGVSGTGPAVAAVVESELEDEVSEAMEAFGRVLKTGVNNFSASVKRLD